MTANRHKHNLRKRTWQLLCLLLVMTFIGPAMPQSGSAAYAASATATVATSAQLKEALADQNVSEIIIDETGILSAVTHTDLGGNKGTPTFEGSDVFYLPVDEPLTVNRAVTIRSANNNKEVRIARSENFQAANNVPGIFNVVSGGNLTLNGRVTMTGEQVAVEFNEGQAETVGQPTKVHFGAGSNKLGLIIDGQVTNMILVLTSNATSLPCWVDNNGFLRCDYNNRSHFVTAGNNNKLEETQSSVGTYLQVYDTKGSTVTNLVPNTEYVLYLRGSATSITASSISGETQTGTAQRYNPPHFKFTINKKDGSSNNETVWTKNEIKEGGYFIHNNGGNVTINEGVTLRSLNTASDAMNAAPVCVTGGSFTMTGGEIADNDVGYGPGNDETLSNGKTIKAINNALTTTEMTNTAGGIIFSGSGVTGILDGGIIGGNRGDAGGIIVTGGASVTMNKPAEAGQEGVIIDSNIGYHHAGAAQVERGGKLIMKGGVMTGNVAWFKGGAVWATQWGTGGYANVDWSVWPKQFPILQNSEAAGSDGVFIMEGGQIINNTAFARAGAIEVESNGVILRSGEISGNKCRSLGGAIYVEGDAASYSYTLTLENTYIGNNVSVMHRQGSQNGSAYDQANYILNSFLSEGTLVGGGGDSWDPAFNGAMGNGGGVWLCPVGGTSVFAGDQVIIDNNDSERNGGGEDFFLCKGNGAMLVQNLEGNWRNESNNKIVNYDNEKGAVLNGPLPLTNTGKVSGGDYGEADAGSAGNRLVIKDNLSRDGGGIACNGTLLFGQAESVDRYDARINITKEWVGVDPTAITFEIGYEDPNGNFVSLMDTTTQKSYTFEMDGNADDGPELEGGSAVGELTPENGKWIASAFIPSYVTLSDGSQYPLYKLQASGESEPFDPTLKSDLTKIRQAIEQGKSFEVVNWKLRVREKNANFQVTVHPIQVDNTKTRVAVQSVDSYNPATGVRDGGFKIYFTTLELTQNIINTSNGIEFTKRGSNNGQPLQGAEFYITEAAKGTGLQSWYVPGTRDMDGASPNNCTIAQRAMNSQPLQADANGKVSVKNSDLKSGKRLNTNSTYLLFETKAPAGYQRKTTPWLVSIDALGNVTITEVSPEYQGKAKGANGGIITSGPDSVYNNWWPYSWYSGSDAIDTKLTIDNDWMPVEVSKTGLGGEALGGAEFSLYKVSGTGYLRVESDRWMADGISSQRDTGTIQLPIREPGLYWLFETRAPKGYIRAEAPWLVHVDDSRNVRVIRLSDANNGQFRNDKFNLVTGTYGDGAEGLKTWIQENQPRWNKEWFNLKSTTSADHGIYEFLADGSSTAEGVIVEGNKLHNKCQPIDLYKVDETDTSQRLAGAKFVLCEAEIDQNNCYLVKKGKDRSESTVWSTAMQDDDGQTIVYTSDSNGRIKITDLDDGAYLLFETEAPAGFVRTTSPWVIKVETTAAGRTVTVKKPKEGFRNKVLGTGSEILTVDPSTPANQQTVAKRWWQDGADSANGWFETMNAENPYQLGNEPKYLTKVDAIDKTKTLEGAQFELYPAYTQQMSGYKSIRRGDSKITNLSSDANGKIHLPSSITSKPSGRTAVAGLSGVYAEGYLLIETEAPSGYERASRPWWIKVDASGNLTVATTTANKRGNSAGGLPYWYTTDFTNSSEGLKIANAPGKLKLTKVDKYDHNKMLSGAQFSFYKASYVRIESGVYKYSKTGNKLGDSSKSGDDGVFTLPPILTENSSQYLFIMEEIEAPEGYEVSDTPWLVSVTKEKAYYWNYDIYENGTYYKYVIKAWPLNEYGSNPSAEEYVISSNCDYSTFVENAPSINLIKVDATTVCYCPCDDMTQITPCEGEDGSDETVYLPNVSFDLYRSSSSWNKTGSPIMEAVSNENGLVELGELADGYYLLYETSNPNASYMVEKKPWKIQVSKNKIIKLMYPQNGTYEESLDKKYITNSPLYELPNAGGIGTHWFALIGLALMAFAAFMLRTRKEA